MLRLAKAEPDAPNRPERIDGEAASAAVLGQVYRRDMLRVLDTEATARRATEQLIGMAPVYRFPVARDLARVEEAADRILAVTLADRPAGR